MKLNTIPPKAFAIISASLFAITGCKQKEQVIDNQVVQSEQALITGQIFIVTKDRQNIVLGDQKIDLLDGKQVMEYFNSKVTEWSNSLEAARSKVSQASAMASIAATNLDLLYKADLDKYTAAKQYHDSIVTSAETGSQEWNDALEWSRKMDENIAQINNLKKQSQQQQALDAAQSTIDVELKDAERLWNEIDWPSPDYFSPTIDRTTTDSNGRFSFVIPSTYKEADLVLFAKADRAVGDENEKYWWMVHVQLSGKKTEVILSNDNKDSCGVYFWFEGPYDPKTGTTVETPFEKYMMHYDGILEAAKAQRDYETFIKKINTQ